MCAGGGAPGALPVPGGSPPAAHGDARALGATRAMRVPAEEERN